MGHWTWGWEEGGCESDGGSGVGNGDLECLSSCAHFAMLTKLVISTTDECLSTLAKRTEEAQFLRHFWVLLLNEYNAS